MHQSTPTKPAIANEFVPDAGGGETTDASVMFGAAYIAFWVALFAFIALSWRRQQMLSSRLDRIESSLAERR